MHENAQSEMVISRREAAQLVGTSTELKRLIQEAYQRTLRKRIRGQTNGEKGLHLAELHEGMRLITRKEGDNRIFIVRGAPAIPSS